MFVASCLAISTVSFGQIPKDTSVPVKGTTPAGDAFTVKLNAWQDADNGDNMKMKISFSIESVPESLGGKASMEVKGETVKSKPITTNPQKNAYMEQIFFIKKNDTTSFTVKLSFPERDFLLQQQVAFDWKKNILKPVDQLTSITKN